LELTSRRSILEGGESGPAGVSGKPDASLLIEAVGYAGQPQMPPAGKLKDAEIVVLRKWAELGFPWPGAAEPSTPSAKTSFQITDEQRQFWAFQPVRPGTPPAVAHGDWPRGEIDRYILAKLEAAQLEPASPADKRTLLRRATFDLTGLPPTPEEVAAFLADDSPEAFATVVEHLLASPQYGERWGRHWLDVVRYADARDTIQLPAESDFREAWRYRDWVVGAVNRDLPYDQFLTHQLAGDLLQPGAPDQIDADALAATGMLAIADFVPGDVNKEQMIADYVNDQVDVVGRAILGLTLACARCHDHKFDPISTKDYYALAGIFFSTRLVPGPLKGNTPIIKVSLLPASQVAAIEAQAAEAKNRFDQLSRQLTEATNREYWTWLKQATSRDSARYLLAAWRHAHPLAGSQPQSLADLAHAEKVDEAMLGRWLKYLQGDHHPQLSDYLAEARSEVAQERSQRLAEQLSVVESLRQPKPDDPIAQALADHELLQFRADDTRIVQSADHQISRWPDHAGLSDDAVAIENFPSPVLTSVIVDGHARWVVRFEGAQRLQVAQAVPASGSLFAVCRAAGNGPASQRLLGWEDSSVGLHGVGLICDVDGAVQGIVRRDGAIGDVRASASSNANFQVIGITWGAQGVTIRRGGKSIETNRAVQAASTDPTIRMLQIGGPGNGMAPMFRGDLAELRVYDAQLDEATCSRVEQELHGRWLDPPISDVAALDDDLYDELTSPRGPYWVPEPNRYQLLSPEAKNRLAPLSGQVEQVKSKTTPDIPRVVSVQEGGPPGTEHEGCRDAWVNIRGNPANRGDLVSRGFPSILVGKNQPIIGAGSGRRELARWLTAADHPLTARVMVNRIWQHHFGEGLVRSSTNFGNRGDRPSHPELLDYLAQQFVASGWSVKNMHRLIMLSSTYQQASEAGAAADAADPENRLLHRMNRRRLDAEEIRDSLLAMAGRLDLAVGGPAFADLTTPRRSVYLMSVRTGQTSDSFGPLFDAANCSTVVERRASSTVAPQALFLMNDPFVLGIADSLADRVANHVGGANEPQRVAHLYQIVFGRPPSPAEVEVALKFLSEQTSDEAWSNYCHLILCTNEAVYVE
jgi:hypothetical protein